MSSLKSVNTYRLHSSLKAAICLATSGILHGTKLLKVDHKRSASIFGNSTASARAPDSFYVFDLPRALKPHHLHSQTSVVLRRHCPYHKADIEPFCHSTWNEKSTPRAHKPYFVAPMLHASDASTLLFFGASFSNPCKLNQTHDFSTGSLIL